MFHPEQQIESMFYELAHQIVCMSYQRVLRAGAMYYGLHNAPLDEHM
jgi:hypothetical protein